MGGLMPTTPTQLSEDDIKSICGREIAAAESHNGTLSAGRHRKERLAVEGGAVVGCDT
jgi:hypothetical protein